MSFLVSYVTFLLIGLKVKLDTRKFQAHPIITFLREGLKKNKKKIMENSI